VEAICAALCRLPLKPRSPLRESAQGFDSMEDKALPINSTLESLELQQNQFSSGEPENLGFLLRLNSTLTYLNLGGNFLGDEGAEIIAKGLTSNQALLFLGLADNSIGLLGRGGGGGGVVVDLLPLLSCELLLALLLYCS